MLTKTDKKPLLFFLIVFVVIILFVSFISRDYLYKGYVQLFHKTTIIAHYNSQRQLDGEYIAYINGRVYCKAYFKDGLREGWCVRYDDTTWKKKNEIFYKQGKPDGIENAYYKSGNLDYTTQWKNGKNYQSEYHYLDNGTLANYNAFDQSKNTDNCYCYVMYDKAGKFHQILGDVFSSFIYSMCNDSIVELTNSSKYRCVNDLYISVATPPKLIEEISVFVNNKSYDSFKIKGNAIFIPDVFTHAGAYQISIIANLRIQNRKIIKADTLKTTIIKE